MPDSFNYSDNPIITNYIQTPIIRTSGKVYVPKNTKRIEALLCGGGGAGGPGGGGFGGLQIYAIPTTGNNLDLVVGAGGVTAGQQGGTTSVSSIGTMYAAVGGGGGGQGVNIHGRNGGGGGLSGNGGSPYNTSLLLWSGLDTLTPTGSSPGDLIFYASTNYVALVLGSAQFATSSVHGCKAMLGYGGAGGGFNSAAATQAPHGGGGAYDAVATGYPGGWGGAGAGGGRGSTVGPSSGGIGGTLIGISIWNITGFTNGTGVTNAAGGGGGGGGGMLSAGSNGVTTVGGNGGDGGGGGGGGWTAVGSGGNGFAMFRFYY